MIISNRSASLLILLPFELMLWGCADLGTDTGGREMPPDNHELVTVTQGIWGNVWVWQGDFMPSTDNVQCGSITPVSREVHIYEATSLQETIPSIGTRFTTVNSRLVQIVGSQGNGFFQASLSPGRYSLFVKEDSALYANWFDGQGYVYPVTVVKDSATKFQIDLTSGATY